MAEIRPLSAIAAKWGRVTPQRTPDYEAGIKAPRRDWEQATSAAEESYEQGVQQAIADQRFGKGVTAAGTAKWRKGALEKGVKRWGPGVQLAKDEYQQGFSRFHDVISALTLPPRFPKGDPRNIDRVRAIAEALHAEKVGA